MAIKRKMNLGFGTDPDSVNMSALPPQSQGQLGGIYETNDKGWQFMQLVDAGPAVAGDVGYYKVSGGAVLFGQATRTIGNSFQNLVAGVFPFASTLNYYTLIRKRGTINVKSADATVTAGKQFTSDAASNQVILLAGIIKPIGVALANQGGGFVSGYLDIPYQ